ncbi:MAG: hypothetical protein U0354_11555 [Candidatus Sericytochromatia bacterium]
MFNLRVKDKRIATSKSIENTLYFITSQNKDIINLGTRPFIIQKNTFFFRSKKSIIRNFFNMFNWK